MNHAEVVIDRLNIPEGVEVEFGMEISFDGGKTWDKDYLDTRSTPAVSYSHRIGATASHAVDPDHRGMTESARGTALPEGVDCRVRVFCSHGVEARAVYS